MLLRCFIRVFLKLGAYQLYVHYFSRLSKCKCCSQKTVFFIKHVKHPIFQSQKVDVFIWLVKLTNSPELVGQSFNFLGLIVNYFKPTWGDSPCLFHKFIKVLRRLLRWPACSNLALSCVRLWISPPRGVWAHVVSHCGGNRRGGVVGKRVAKDWKSSQNMRPHKLSWMTMWKRQRSD